jgi:G:T-mismatch repair DNA endonuclease (very short patch repair protein)
MRKAWATRRKDGKPYPETARCKARARACERINKGFNVSAFERKAANVFRELGFRILTSVKCQGADGRFVAVYDIVIPSRGIVVECHGGYWHGGRWTFTSANSTQLRNLAHEESKLALARSAGLDLRILWEQDFRKDPCGACLASVR